MRALESGWQEISIPFTWNAKDLQNDKNSFYAGESYYRKTYRPDLSLSDKRIFLRFEGVASIAQIYANKVYAGNHKGGYSAFAIEFTELLNFGEDNEILVKTDNSSLPDVIPINHTLFGLYGGIYRPVNLIITEKLNISVTDYGSPGIYISQDEVSEKSADISIKIQIENKNKQSQNATLKTCIFDMSGMMKYKKEDVLNFLPQGRQIFQQNVVMQTPHLWQGLDDPYLYKVVIHIVTQNGVIDQVVQPLGIRHFKLKAKYRMYLNGRKVPMYGVCRHQD